MTKHLGWWLGVIVFAVASWAPALEFNKYHSQKEMNEYLQGLAEEFPELVKFHKLGQSEKGLELNYVTITQTDAPDATAIYVNGTHHGDEKSSTESVLAIVDYVVENRDRADINALLKQYLIIAQPIVNADGHLANTRHDALNRDPNRDYAYPGFDESKAFKSKGIQLVRDLMAQYKVRGAIAFHSGMVGVLWPWCHTSSQTQLQDTFYTISKATAQAMDFNYYRQSYFDYPTNGEFIDYAFMKHGTMGVTIEVSSAKNPPASQLASVVKRSVDGTLAYIESIRALDEGRLVIEAANRSAWHGQGFNPLFLNAGKKTE